MSDHVLSPADCAQFTRDGFLLLPPIDAARCARWVEEIAAAEVPGLSIRHYEQTRAGRVLCRAEGFIDEHAELRAFVEGPLQEMASTLLGEAAVPYKEKINFKLPGGAGFKAHQDAPAFPHADHHLTCMVAVDAADAASGCLEFARIQPQELLPQDEGGCIDEAVAAGLAWQALSCAAGSLCWFHSKTPHRSGPNRSPRPRRAMFITFNAARLGAHRAEYYAEKRRGEVDMESLSRIRHFQGITDETQR